MAVAKISNTTTVFEIFNNYLSKFYSLCIKCIKCKKDSSTFTNYSKLSKQFLWTNSQFDNISMNRLNFFID